MRVYVGGKGAVSGLGEAAMDRALADAEWLRVRLAELEQGRPLRAKGWAALALARADLHVCWAVTDDQQGAVALERAVQLSFDGAPLWNRARPVREEER